MKKLDISHHVISFLLLVALFATLFYVVGLNNKVVVISEDLVTSKDELVTLREEVKLANSYSKQTKKGIDGLRDDLNAVVSSIDTISGDTKPLGVQQTKVEAFPYVEIWRGDSYTINRSEQKNARGNLTWVIMYNGEVALQRNAKGEMSYTYFSKDKGSYVIYMTDFVDGQYRVISNVVSYIID